VSKDQTPLFLICYVFAVQHVVQQIGYTKKWKQAEFLPLHRPLISLSNVKRHSLVKYWRIEHLRRVHSDVTELNCCSPIDQFSYVAVYAS